MRWRAWGSSWPRGTCAQRPAPAPTRRDDGACRFCPYALICNVSPVDEDGEVEE